MLRGKLKFAVTTTLRARSCECTLSCTRVRAQRTNEHTHTHTHTHTHGRKENTHTHTHTHTSIHMARTKNKHAHTHTHTHTHSPPNTPLLFHRSATGPHFTPFLCTPERAEGVGRGGVKLLRLINCSWVPAQDRRRPHKTIRRGYFLLTRGMFHHTEPRPCGNRRLFRSWWAFFFFFLNN